MRLGDIARLLEADLEGDGEVEIAACAPLEAAGPGTITFLADPRLRGRLATTRASAVILPRDGTPSPVPALRVAQPYLAFVQVLERLHPSPRPDPGIHPTAILGRDTRLGPNAHVGPYVVIGDRVVVGADAVIHARVTVYNDVEIGDAFTAHAGAVVREGVRIGHRVTLHAGVVIGSDGFGFLPLPEGTRKIPQVGTVVLEDDVEIGANSTVDRAMLGETRIGRATKIDNLVMIGHGSAVGPGCLLAAQVGLAGGTRLGARVMMGGQAGASGHLTIGEGARVAAQAGVHQDVPPGAVVGGSPALPVETYRRVSAALSRLPEALRRLRRLERLLGHAGPHGNRPHP